MPARATEQAEAEPGDNVTTAAAETRTAYIKRTALLAALTATAFSTLWYGFHQGKSEVGAMPPHGGLLWLIVAFFAACTVCAGVGRWARASVAWARFVRLINAIPLIWYPLATACLASFVIGQVANSQPPPDNYWPLFALWLVSMGAVVASIATGLRLSELRPAALKQRLWPYRWELAGITALTIAGAIIRVVILTSLPLPFEQDEAAMAHESLHVLEGVTQNMFMSGLQGHPIMQFLAEGVFLKIFGVNVFGIRMISAVGGTIGIPLFYLLLRQMFGRPIAIIGAVYLMGYHLHVAYSRIGMENIGDPLLMTVTFFFAWRATREGKTSDFVLTGLVMGLGLYLYQGSRVVPLIVAAYFGYCFLRRPAFLKRLLPGSGMLALAYGAAAFPLAIFWFTHQSFFMDRINVVGIFQSHWIDQQRAATGDSTLSILWDQAVHAFGGFGFYVERGIFYRAPIPFVDRLSLIPFLLGLAYALYHVLDERYFLLLTGFAAVVITGGILTVEPPMASRLLGTAPIVVAFIAIGIKLIADTVSRWRPSASSLVAGVAVAALVTTNIHFYFFDYKDGGYSSDLNNRVAAQVVDYVRTLPEDTRLFWYGDPRMYLSGSGHPAMTFPLRDRPRFDVLLDGRVVSNPVADVADETPAVFMFLPHRESEMQPLMDSCPGGEFRVFIMPGGRHGLQGVQDADVSFLAYEVLAPNRCVPLTARK
jgi:4-amino-4-deoxy-L-arabinose transferase-like glycosyltransferase